MDIKSICKITLFSIFFVLSGCIANPYVVPVIKKNPPVIYIPDRVIYPPVFYPKVFYPSFVYPVNYTTPFINNWSKYYFRKKFIDYKINKLKYNRNAR